MIDCPKSPGTHAVVVGPSGITNERRNLRHGLNADDTFDSEVGLVREGAREVVRAELFGGDEGVLDQELRPLVEEAELWIITT